MKKLLLLIILIYSPLGFTYHADEELCSHLKVVEELEEQELEKHIEEAKEFTQLILLLQELKSGEEYKPKEGILSESSIKSHLLYQMAHCYIDGVSVEKDVEKGLSYLSKSADMGDEGAEHELASIRLFHLDDPKLKKLGFKYFKAQYEKKGSAYDAGKLGWAYQDGLGVEKNLKKAKELYEYAAKNGMTYWQFLLAHAYKMGYLEYTKNFEKYKYWLEYEPRVHVDSYDCWVAYYYKNGIYPENESEQEKHQEKCDIYRKKKKS